MPQSVLITGASGVLGNTLAEHMKNAGYVVSALSRRNPHVPGVHWIQLDMTREIDLERAYDIVVHAAPLWLLPNCITAMTKSDTTRIIAFSSTSATTKRQSTDLVERRVADALLTAENDCIRLCTQRSMDLTLFRPTMIYGFCRDKNITSIAKTIKRVRFFPVAGPGLGMRQPVHVLDLVAGVSSCLNTGTTFGKTYALSGHECLSYTHMVERIFKGLGMTPRVIHIPVGLYKLLVTGIRKTGIVSNIAPTMADRMNNDLCFDHSEATKDFGFQGSPFLEKPSRDLPL